MNRRNFLASGAALGTSALFSSSAFALFGGLGGGATEITQLANNVQLALQYAEQVKMYLDMIEQAKNLPGQIFKEITGELQAVIDVYNQARSLGRKIEGLDEAFRAQFKGYENYLKNIGKATEMMPQRYEQWATSGLDNVRTAMKSAGMNVSSFDDEISMLNQIVSRSGSAAGRLQAIQAGNEIAAQNVQQLQKLRDMVATQITMQANFMATQTERQAVDDAIVEDFKRVKPNNSPSRSFGPF